MHGRANNLWPWHQHFFNLSLFVIKVNECALSVKPILQNLEEGPFLGESMYEAYKRGSSCLPEIVDYDGEDEYVVQLVKDLISKMTSYYPSERPSAGDVVKETTAISRNTHVNLCFILMQWTSFVPCGLLSLAQYNITLHSIYYWYPDVYAY